MRPTLAIDPKEWDHVGAKDPSDVLGVSLYIGGTLHHVEAVAVRRGRDGYQVAADPAMQSTLNAMERIYGAGSFDRFGTVRIGRRNYVLNMTPGK